MAIVDSPNRFNGFFPPLPARHHSAPSLRSALLQRIFARVKNDAEIIKQTEARIRSTKRILARTRELIARSQALIHADKDSIRHLKRAKSQRRK